MFGTSSPMYGFLHFTGRGRERIKPRSTGSINRYVGSSPGAVPYESQARVQRIPQWYFHRGLSKWTGVGEHMGGGDPECAGMAASRDEGRVHQAREYACDAQSATSGVRWGATFSACYSKGCVYPVPQTSCSKVCNRRSSAETLETVCTLGRGKIHIMGTQGVPRATRI